MRPLKALLSAERRAASGQLVSVRSCAESAQSDADSIRPTGLQPAAPVSARWTAELSALLCGCADRLCPADTFCPLGTDAGPPGGHNLHSFGLRAERTAAVSAPAVSAGRCVRTASAAALMRTQLRRYNGLCRRTAGAVLASKVVKYPRKGRLVAPKFNAMHQLLIYHNLKKLDNFLQRF